MKKVLLIILLGIIVNAQDFKLSHHYSEHNDEFTVKSSFKGSMSSEGNETLIDAKRRATKQLDKYNMLIKNKFVVDNGSNDMFLDAEISSVNESIKFGINHTINSDDTEFTFNWDSRIKTAYSAHKLRVGADLYPEDKLSPFVFLEHNTRPQYLRQGIGVKWTFLPQKYVLPGKNSLSWAIIDEDGMLLSSLRHKIEYVNPIFQFKRTHFVVNGQDYVDGSFKFKIRPVEDTELMIGGKYKADTNEETYSDVVEIKHKDSFGVSYEHKYEAVHGQEIIMWAALTKKINVEYSLDIYDGDKTSSIGFEVEL